MWKHSLIFFLVFLFGLNAETYLAFLFYNELDLLQIHLDEMYDAVDHIIIHESCETFMGNPKPFFFDEHKKRFEKYLDKIIHNKTTTKVKTDDPWVREHFQRDQMLEALRGCKVDDLVLLCDCDEIVSAPNLAKG